MVFSALKQALFSMLLKMEEKHDPQKDNGVEEHVPSSSMFKQRRVAFTYTEAAEILTFWAR